MSVKPLLLDETGQQMVAALNKIANKSGAVGGSSIELAPTLENNEEDKAPSVKAVNEGLYEAHKFSPRALIKQIMFINEEGAVVNFSDIYVSPFTSFSLPQGRYNYFVYGLTPPQWGGTAQDVYQSTDGGETWKKHASLPMNQANGMWYTDFAVDHDANSIYLVKTTDGYVSQNNKVVTFYKSGADGNWYQRTEEVDLGKKTWLTNNSLEIMASTDKTKRVVLFGEYGTTEDGTSYAIWRTEDSGISWSKVLEIQGNNNGVDGEIRHWHTVKVDPYTNHLWASAGDNDAQCKIYRSTDDGMTWELMFSGSQRERTCCFLFEEDCIYYGMDAKRGADANFTRIVKIDKNKLDTDKENSREFLASVHCCRPVYGLTKTFNPEGFLVWTQHEPSASFTSDEYVLEFYDYASKELYPVARFDISGISLDKYIGFYAGSRYQSMVSGNIFAKPTNTMQWDKYDAGYVSKHVKINLTY